jgi:glutamate/tyrosine decarboxylase-like PLP-dependent enzyme
VDKILEFSVKGNHRHFHNQLFSGVSKFAVAGEFITSSLNGSMYTYEIAPVLSLMEAHVINLMKKWMGWNTIDGIGTPGGSIANFMAVLIARHKEYPEVKTKGMRGVKDDLKLITSEQSHYSICKAAIIAGLGLESIVYVKCDETGHMIPEELEKTVEEILSNGGKPFLVNATMGTTVIGAIDDIE